MPNTYTVVRSDGKTLGSFDTQDRAEMAADRNARGAGFTLKWSRSMGGGGIGSPEMPSRYTHEYRIEVNRDPE